MQGAGEPPDPQRYGDWRAYASALRTYLSGGYQTAGVGNEAVPQAILLAQRDADSRAFTDGIEMWDPVLLQVVVSKGGEWVPVGTDVVVVSMSATADAGNGTVEGDINATDFTGQPYAVGTAIQLPPNCIVRAYHKDVGYDYTGPRDTTVGLGGAYVTTAGDYQPTGIGSHSLLSDLDADDHPQYFNAARGDARYYPQGQVDGKDAALQAQIDTNASKNAEQDGRLSANETSIAANAAAIALNASNLEWMYDLFLDIFVIAVKGGARMVTSTPFADLGAGWQTLDLFDAETIIPTGVTINLVANTFSVDEESEVLMQVTGAFSHAALNAGRETFLRLFNVTKGSAEAGVPIGTGRNAEITNMAASAAFLVDATVVGDVFRVEIGGGDAYTAVEFEQFSLTITSAGPWLGPRPEIPTS